MSLWKLPRAYGNLVRLREIAMILAAHGLGHFVHRLRLTEYIPGMKRAALALEGRSQGSGEGVHPDQIVRLLEDLGPTFIKFGQLLANRPDLIPPRYQQALTHLQDQVEPFPTEEARKTIEDSLQRPIDEVFLEIDDRPIASGSIGQVHTARLKDGQPVVVKVKRPGTDRRIREDIELLLWFAGLVERHLPELAVLRPRVLVEEFSRSIRREIDFVAEASYTSKFALDFDDPAELVTPAVYWEYVSHDVVVLERLRGTPASSPEAAALPYALRQSVAAKLADSFMKQFFLTGLFHADPHPGNILILPHGRVALIDFGQTGHLSQEMRQQLALTLAAVANGEIDTIADIYCDLGGVTAETDLLTFKGSLADLVDRYYGVPVEKIDMRQLFDDVVTMAREHGVFLPRNLVLLMKSLVTAVGVAQRLDPEFRLDKVARPYTRRILRNQLKPQNLLRGGLFSAFKLFHLARRAPRDLQDLLNKARNGELRVIFHHEALESISERLDRASNRLSIALVVGSMIVGSSLVLTTQDLGKSPLPLLGEVSLAYVLATFGFVAAVALGFVLIWSIFRGERKRDR